MKKIIRLIKNKHLRRVVLFCFTGGVATLIDLFFFNIFFFLTSAFVISRIGGILSSVAFNFTFNRNVTFRAKNIRVHHQLWKFVIIYGISMTSNVLVGKLVLSFLDNSTLSANIAAISGLAVSIPIGFFGLINTLKRGSLGKGAGRDSLGKGFISSLSLRRDGWICSQLN